MKKNQVGSNDLQSVSDAAKTPEDLDKLLKEADEMMLIKRSQEMQKNQMLQEKQLDQPFDTMSNKSAKNLLEEQVSPITRENEKVEQKKLNQTRDIEDEPGNTGRELSQFQTLEQEKKKDQVNLAPVQFNQSPAPVLSGTKHQQRDSIVTAIPTPQTAFPVLDTNKVVQAPTFQPNTIETQEEQQSIVELLKKQKKQNYQVEPVSNEYFSETQKNIDILPKIDENQAQQENNSEDTNEEDCSWPSDENEQVVVKENEDFVDQFLDEEQNRIIQHNEDEFNTDDQYDEDEKLDNFMGEDTDEDKEEESVMQKTQEKIQNKKEYEEDENEADNERFYDELMRATEVSKAKYQEFKDDIKDLMPKQKTVLLQKKLLKKSGLSKAHKSTMFEENVNNQKQDIDSTDQVKLKIAGMFGKSIIGKQKKEDDDDEKEDDDDDNNQEELPEIHWNRLFTETEKRDTKEFPFTKCHIEDCLFFEYTDLDGQTERQIIAFEAIMYQQDCHYCLLKQNETSNINRMGTENYNQADIFQRTEKVPFSQPPINMIIDREKAYLKQIKKNLSFTKCRDAKVEYFLSRWKINQRGGLTKIQQSKSFNMQGRFIGHYKQIMQLELSDDQKLVFLVQNYDEEKDIETRMKIWSTHDLKPYKQQPQKQNLKNILDEFSTVQKIQYQMQQQFKKSLKENKTLRNQLKEKYKRTKEEEQTTRRKSTFFNAGASGNFNKSTTVKLDKNLKNMSQKGPMSVITVGKLGKIQEDIDETYIKQNQLRIQLIRNSGVISFYNLIFDQQYLYTVSSYELNKKMTSKIEIYELESGNKVIDFDPRFEKDGNFPNISKQYEDGVLLFAVKLFIDNKKSEKQCPKARILFVMNKQFEYTDSNDDIALGWPWMLVEYDFLEIVKAYKEGGTYQCIEKQNEYIMKIASQKFKPIYNLSAGNDIMNIEKIANNDKNFKKAENNIYGRLFMLDNDMIFFDKEVDINKRVPNLLEYLDIIATVDFEYIAFNNMLESKQELQVYSKTYSRRQKSLSYMNALKTEDEDTQTELHLVRNQHLKKRIYCIQRSMEETKCFSYFWQDLEANEKYFKFEHNHHYAEQDVMMVIKEDECEDNDAQPKLKEQQTLKKGEDSLDTFKHSVMFSLTIQEHSQEMTFRSYQINQGENTIKKKTERQSDNQVFITKYPVLVGNLGFKKLCIHINLNQHAPKALILDINMQIDKQKSKDEYIFVGFVDYGSFDDVQLHTKNIDIGTCARILFLTTKQVDYSDKSSIEDPRLWLNLLLIDAFNNIPQVVRFKTKKIFEFSQKEYFQDVMLKNIIYKQGKECHMISQFPLGLHHSYLQFDKIREQEKQEKEQDNATNDQQSDGGRSYKSKRSTQSKNSAEMAKEEEEEKARQIELKLKLYKRFCDPLHPLCPVLIFKDKDTSQNIIYYAIQHIENQKNQVKIQQFNPDLELDKQISTILTLNMKNIFDFGQTIQLNFYVIDINGNIRIYEKDNDQLEPQYSMHMHPNDRKYIRTNNYSYQYIRFYESDCGNQGALVLERKVIHLNKDKNKLVDGILESEDLLQNMRSNVDFVKIDGPYQYTGQAAFLVMYVYKDALYDNFYYRIRIYRTPINPIKYLLQNHSNDEVNDSVFTTFLSDGTILGKYTSRFYKFTEQGDPLGEVEFAGQFMKHKGENQYSGIDEIFYIVYWHEFQCNNDDGLNKQVFINNQDEIYDATKQNAVEFYTKIKDRGRPAIVVKINKNIGLEFIICDKGQRETELMNLARTQYFQRYELETMSEDNEYFLFYDNFLRRYGLWELQDQTQTLLRRNLLKYSKKGWKSLKKSTTFSDSVQQKQKSSKKSGSPRSPRLSRTIQSLTDVLIEVKDSFPEIDNKVSECNERMKRIYIKKYARPIFLGGGHATITTHELPIDNWASFNKENLLNGNMSKFMSLTKDNMINNLKSGVIKKSIKRFIEIVLKKPVYACAIGLRSANDFPHLDPSIVSIWYYIAGRQEQDEKKEIVLNKQVIFTRRFQIRHFIKDQPNETIDKIRIEIDDTKGNQYEFQLAQVLIYEKVRNSEFQFVKLFDVPLLEKTQMFNFLEATKNNLEQTYNDNLKKLAFLSQKNVINHILVDKLSNDRKKISVCFAFCNADWKNENLNFVGSIFSIIYKPKKVMYLENDIRISNFHRLLELDSDTYKKEVASIEDKIKILEIQAQKRQIIENGKENYQKNKKIFSQFHRKIRAQNQDFNFISIPKFTSQYVIIIQGNNVQYLNIDNLIQAEQESEDDNMFLNLFKQKQESENSQNLEDEGLVIMEEITKTKRVKLRLSDDSLDIDVLDVFITDESHVIQILAKEATQKVIMIATWDLELNVEKSMFQISSDIEKPEKYFLQGVKNKKEAASVKDEGDLNLIEKLQQGSMNYYLHDNILYDLENNVPFMYLPKGWGDHDEHNPNYPNERNMFYNSSRCLSIKDPNMLVFGFSKKNVQFWCNILKNPQTRIENLEQTCDIIDAFQIKYGRGISLFHNFAGETDIISLFHSTYIQAQKEKTLKTKTRKDVPLLILSPDDRTHKGAIECAILNQKPNNFEMMIDMLTDFNDICSSKMMLGSLSKMLNDGQTQILEYFDKTNYNPPLMQTPIYMQWPEEMDEFIMASKASILDSDVLTQIIKGPKGQSHLHRKKLLFFLYEFFYIDYILSKTGLDRILPERYQTIDENSPWKRVIVQALDFDWIFEKDNATRFLQILASSDKDEFLEKSSIKNLLELLWNYYKPAIIKNDFIPYSFYLIFWFHFTYEANYQYSSCSATYRNEIIDIDEEGSLPEGALIIINYDNCGDGVVAWMFIQIVISALFILKFAYREFKQLIVKGVVEYIFDFWNWGDILSIVANTYYLILLMQGYFEHDDNQMSYEMKCLLRTTAGLTVFLMILKMFYWMKIYHVTGYFLAQLEATYYEIPGFMIMLIFTYIAFGSYFYHANLNALDDNEVGRQVAELEGTVWKNYYYIDSYFKQPDVDQDDHKMGLFEATMRMFLVSIGDFDYSGFKKGYNTNSLWLFLIVAQFLIMLVFMNMLINVMAQPFGEVSENKDMYRNRQRVEMIIDHISLVDVKNEFLEYRYIMIVKPEESQIDVETIEHMVFDIQVKLKNLSRKVGFHSSNIEEMVSQLKTQVELLISQSKKAEKQKPKIQESAQAKPAASTK